MRKGAKQMATNRENIKSDLFDTSLSVRFELVKHLKHRRLLIVAALAVILPLFPLISRPDTAAEFAATSLNFVSVMIIISAAMFAGDAVCGEFEKKTSLLLFPTPQNRTSIFAGKYVAALMCTFLAASLWYLVLTLEIGPIYGWREIPADLWKSFLTALIYSASAVSIVFLLSSLLKRSMPATIVGFLVLVMILPIVSMIMTQLDWEPWFIVTYSAGLITNVLGVSSSLPMGPHGDVVQQFTPTFGKGIAVMVAYAIVAFVIGMVLANRKSEE
jgi:ABC-type transport system involved in multi-copper enzyme maturation permease subunit